MWNPSISSSVVTIPSSSPFGASAAAGEGAAGRVATGSVPSSADWIRWWTCSLMNSRKASPTSCVNCCLTAAVNGPL